MRSFLVREAFVIAFVKNHLDSPTILRETVHIYISVSIVKDISVSVEGWWSRIRTWVGGAGLMTGIYYDEGIPFCSLRRCLPTCSSLLYVTTIYSVTCHLLVVIGHVRRRSSNRSLVLLKQGLRSPSGMGIAQSDLDPAESIHAYA